MSRRTGPALVALLCGAVSLLAETSAFCQESTATVASLRCEYLQDPLGLGVRDPRLFWQISSSSRGERQTAYQVIVASDESRLDETRADLWNSGRVESSQTTHVVYA
jgi:alpha-L-rhamnosidase